MLTVQDLGKLFHFCEPQFLYRKTIVVRGFPGGSDGKESACNVGDPGLIPGSGRFPWRRKWHPTPVFLPGESHGQRSLEIYSPWSHKELDMTEQLILSLLKYLQDI